MAFMLARHRPTLFVCVFAALAGAFLPSRAHGAGIEYNRDIRPILAANCFACHGPDSASRKADLRLDQREVAVKMSAINPGEPEQSELVRRIHSSDADERMPPPASKKTLTQDEIHKLEQWIGEGAHYQPHWSLIPPTKPALRQVKNGAWVRNPIDALVLTRLEDIGLSPAPEADKRTLARRLSLDLTGLPPTPEFVHDFLADDSPDAYENRVDKLLASPHYGEHRGRYWLDAARYADTHGIHFDNYREMWTFRDWVINAFNRNQHFDEFTIEQLAGDLLPNRTLEQEIGSGFNRCNITTNEGGIIDEEYLVLYTRDRTETTAQVWLGFTAGCAVCHDHKFDSFSQREFYELSAFFNNVKQDAKDGNIKDTPPVEVVAREEDRARWNSIPGDLKAVEREIKTHRDQARPAFAAWLADTSADSLLSSTPRDSMQLYASLSDGDSDTLDVTIDSTQHSLHSTGLTWDRGQIGKQALKMTPSVAVELPEVGDFERDQAFSYATWVKFPKAQTTGAVLSRMDNENKHRGWDLWVEENKIATHIIHEWPENALKVVAKMPLKENEWHHVLVTYDGSSKSTGVKIYYDGEVQQTDVKSKSLTKTIRTDTPWRLAQRRTESRLNDIYLQDVRVYGRLLSEGEATKLARSARIATLVDRGNDRTEAETNELFEWWIASADEQHAELRRKQAALEKERDEIKRRGTVAHVMQEKPGAPMAFILNRGEYDHRKDEVHPHTPAMLPPMPEDLPHNRLGLARWLLMPENPLTARVTVNRFWQEIFGAGLVRTPGDFGVSGEVPANQELLDWLAVDFRESGWDVKRFFKQIVMSATYRQAALNTPEKLEKDPFNKLYSRGPRFRMDAEMIRDYALSASGLLQDKIGGPSVRPYQPPGVWEAVAMPGSTTRNYVQDKGESLYRRSMYTFWKRAAPPASMDIFNAPTRENCTVRRERTNTPLQALVTLNDPQFVEAARTLAQSILETDANVDDRLQSLAERILDRPFRAEELAICKSSLIDLLSYYASHTEDATKVVTVGDSKPDGKLAPPVLAAWTMLANEMLNLDEALNK
jgi:mono/diheme cytochrome c family protein